MMISNINKNKSKSISGCCCSIPLNLGVSIIAFIELLIWSILVFKDSYKIINSEFFCDIKDDKYNVAVAIKDIGSTATIIMLYGLAIACLITSIIGFFGAMNQNKKLLNVFRIAWRIKMVIISLGSIIAMNIGIFYPQIILEHCSQHINDTALELEGVEKLIAIAVIILFATIIAICVYLYCVVNRFYKSLGENKLDKMVDEYDTDEDEQVINCMDIEINGLR